MALLDKLSSSVLGLSGKQPQNFGVNPIPPNSLHNQYSVNGIPDITWRLSKGGRAMDTQPSQLDELDAYAPGLKPVGVVSQVYKSKQGLRYKDLGPTEGRY
jgi:hypothetical protein